MCNKNKNKNGELSKHKGCFFQQLWYFTLWLLSISHTITSLLLQLQLLEKNISLFRALSKGTEKGVKLFRQVCGNSVKSAWFPEWRQRVALAFLYALWFIFVFLRFDVNFNIRNCCASAFGRKELEVNVNALFFFFFGRKVKSCWILVCLNHLICCLKVKSAVVSFIILEFSSPAETRISYWDWLIA